MIEIYLLCCVTVVYVWMNTRFLQENRFLGSGWIFLANVEKGGWDFLNNFLIFQKISKKS